MNEAMVAAVRDYERSALDEKYKVALRLVDAFSIDFGSVSAELARAAHQYFSDAEIIDIGMKLFGSTTNKMRVVLHADDPEGIEEAIGIRTREYPVAPDFVPGLDERDRS
jgi:hypothetical protein